MRDCTASFGSKSPRNPILLKSHLFEKKVERILDKNPILLKSHLCGKVLYRGAKKLGVLRLQNLQKKRL